MNPTTRKLAMSAWLVFAACIVTAFVSGGFAYAGYKRHDWMLWAAGAVSFLVINGTGVKVLADYWRE